MLVGRGPPSGRGSKKISSARRESSARSAPPQSADRVKVRPDPPEIRVGVRDGVELLVTRFTGAAPLPLFIDLTSFDDKHAF